MPSDRNRNTGTVVPVVPSCVSVKVLIIGSGGREHALAWKAAQSPRVTQVFVAPGNAGTALEPRVKNVGVAADDLPGLVRFALDEKIDLTIVGPEGPLVLGVTDEFSAAGLRCFGPSREAARLEGSKAYMKEFLRRHSIPTAAYATFTRSNFDPAWIRAQRGPLVVKADGLAAGKGVVICQDVDEAIEVAEAMFTGRFGDAGTTIVVEEFLEGEEASFIAMVDGTHVLPLATSQDHKRRDDGDLGPNTGGMGAYSPAPVVTKEVHERAMREVMWPTVRALAAAGTPYVGFLYAGLMIATDGTPKVLEFNCRLGDPETQPILARMRSDITELCDAALDGKLGEASVDWDPRAAVGVVLAAGGYPDDARKGDVIRGLDAAAMLPGKVFHAATTLAGDSVVTNGGRVLCAVGLGESVRQRSGRPTTWPPRSTGTACSIGATSATGRSPASSACRMIRPMRTKRHAPARLTALACLLLAGCQSLGPAAVVAGRPAYNDVIARTSAEQTLGLIVRVRYGDPIGLLEVSNVTANLKFSAHATGQFGIGAKSNYDGNLVPLSAALGYEDSPTISYQPIAGQAFLTEWLQPISLDTAILSARVAGNDAGVFALIVDRLNGLRSGAAATPAQRTKFFQAVILLDEFHRLGIAEWVSPDKPDGNYELVIAAYAPAHTAQVEELLALLGTPASTRDGAEIRLAASLDSRRQGDAPLAFRTRSVGEIMRSAAQGISVPAPHVAAGVVAPSPAGAMDVGLKIRSSREAPESASLVVQHRGWWFYVEDTDLQSKHVFQQIQLLFMSAIAEASAGNRAAPLLTIPVR